VFAKLYRDNNHMLRTVAFSLLLASTNIVSAQVLTPDEILAMVNKKVEIAGPYAELLNDPDPARQLAAIEIMMETKDASLVAMAARAGFLSTDPDVRQKTLEGYLATGPSISIIIDGSATDDSWFESSMKEAGAAVSPEGVAGVTYAVGDYDTEKRCYVFVGASADSCFLQVSNAGVEATAPGGYFKLQGSLSDAGTIEGFASVYNTSGGFPSTIRLLP